jgi:hypothetical protein
MKYNEAIDMIFDGGEAYNDIDESIVYYFHKRGGNLIFSEIDKKQLRRAKDYGYGMEAILTRKKIDANWIVEKDGVVYEEYPIGKMHIIEQKVPIDMIRKMLFIKDRTYNQDEPAELEEGGKPWEQIKMPIIADEVDEDWLEKKILCFMKRVYVAGGIERVGRKEDGRIVEIIKPSLDIVRDFNCEDENCHLCCNENDEMCDVCFPQEQPKTDHIEEPRDKVTVEDVLHLINGVVGAEIADTMALFCPNYDEETRGKMRKGSSEALEFWGGKLKQKIQYLVSLQEK